MDPLADLGDEPHELTGQTSEEGAIEAFRRGASDYVVKGDSYVEALATRVRGLVAAA